MGPESVAVHHHRLHTARGPGTAAAALQAAQEAMGLPTRPPSVRDSTSLLALADKKISPTGFRWVTLQGFFARGSCSMPATGQWELHYRRDCALSARRAHG